MRTRIQSYGCTLLHVQNMFFSKKKYILFVEQELLKNLLFSFNSIIMGEKSKFIE